MIGRLLCVCLAALLPLGGCELLDRDAYMPGEAARELAASLQARASAKNRAVAIPFDPARDALVFDGSLQLASVSRELVAAHGLPAAWRGSPEPGQPGEAIRLAPRPLCEEVQGDPALRAGGARADLLPPPQGPASCLLILPEPAPARAFRVSMSLQPLVSDEARVDRLLTVVDAPDGRRYAFEHYRLRGLSGPDLRASELAAALGLSGDGRRPEAELRALVDAQRGFGGVTSAQRLTAFLGGAGALSSQDVERLLATPERLRPYGEQIVRVYAEALARPQDDGTRANVAARLVAGLPAEAFRAHSSAILATLAANPGPSDDPPDTLISRLPELGADAAPVLAKMIAAHRAASRDPTYAHYAALCRLASAPDAGLRADLLHYWDKANQRWAMTYPRRRQRTVREAFDFKYQARLSDAESLLYVTLLRLGLREEADAMAAHHQAARYRQRGLHVTPASPPNVCAASTVA